MLTLSLPNKLAVPRQKRAEPFPKRLNLDDSKLKELADDNFKFDENGRKLSKRVEYTMRKGEIACYKSFKTLWEKEKLLVTSNFSFSHSVFKRLLLQTRKDQGLFWKGLTNDTKQDIMYLQKHYSNCLSTQLTKR